MYMRPSQRDRFRAFHVESGSVLVGTVLKVLGAYATVYEVRCDGITTPLTITYPQWEVRRIDPLPE